MMKYFIVIIAIMIIIAIIITAMKKQNNRKKIDPIKVMILNAIKTKEPISITELEKYCDNHEISPDVVEETRQVITITD